MGESNGVATKDRHGRPPPAADETKAKRFNRLSNRQVREMLNHIDNHRDRFNRDESLASWVDLAAVVSRELGFHVSRFQVRDGWVVDLKIDPPDWLRREAAKRAVHARAARGDKVVSAEVSPDGMPPGKKAVSLYSHTVKAVLRTAEDVAALAAKVDALTAAVADLAAVAAQTREQVASLVAEWRG